jgi:hypothetical protein
MSTKTEKSRERMQPAERPVALLFINTTHPSDATTRSSLSKIRSHAAKEIRSRVLKSRKTVLLPGNIQKIRGLEQPKQNASDRQSDTQACLALASNEDHEDTEPLASVLASRSLSGPQQVTGLSRVAQIWASARPFSVKENVLLDHCASISSLRSPDSACITD